MNKKERSPETKFIYRQSPQQMNYLLIPFYSVILVPSNGLGIFHGLAILGDKFDCFNTSTDTY